MDKTPNPNFDDEQHGAATNLQTTGQLSAADAAPDPFDPANLRLGQDFPSEVGVKKVLTTVQCRKPGRHEFVRIRPGEEWCLDTMLFEDRINRDIYLVDRKLW